MLLQLSDQLKILFPIFTGSFEAQVGKLECIKGSSVSFTPGRGIGNNRTHKGKCQLGLLDERARCKATQGRSGRMKVPNWVVKMKTRA